MSKKFIAIDFDDTICNSSKFILETYNNTINGKKIAYKDLKTEKYLSDEFNLDNDQILEVLKKTLLSEKFLEFCLPILGSQKRIAELKKDGHKLVLLTGRADDVFYDHTFKWIQKHFYGMFEKLYFAENITKNIKRKKSEICEQEGVEILIDDMTTYISDLKEVGTKGYLFNAPWNQTYPVDNDRVMRLNKREELIV